MIPRLVESIVLKRSTSQDKIIVILGARQVGKTTLLNNLRQKLEERGGKVLYLNCDIEEDRAVINTTSRTVLQRLVGNNNYLFVDEAQRLDNPGLTLKVVYDNFKNLKTVATGSSGFDLKNRISDALTGRYLDFILYPLSFSEVFATLDVSPNKALRKKQADTLLEDILLYGLYPEVYKTTRREDKALYLEKIVESYLFKDILAFQKVRYSQAIKDLTRALAYQIGSEVNENELATRLKIDRKTVVNYLDLLEQSFVILRLFPYSKNPRREIGKKYKAYFADLGVRNVLIGDFNPPRIRDDLGALWENFLIVERIKSFANRGESVRNYFWRTYGGAEVDYLERPLTPEKMQAFEIKYTQEVLSRGAKIFSETYAVPVTLINKENYLDFISQET
jgi:predicted AAA+ superfamily ATPase